MATANPTVRQSLSLPQLLALSEEIACLARAGVPLDQGLRTLGRELPGKLGTVADDIGAQIAAGVPLDQAITRSGVQFPPGYKGLLEAGLRSGNLPGVLQGMMRLARQTGEVRRQITLAAINPLLVVAVTYVLFLFWLAKLAPVYLEMASDWGINVSIAAAIVHWLQDWEPVWGRLVPLFLLVILIWSWLRAARGTGEWSVLDLFTLGIVRRIGLMRRAGELASLCEQLAILLEHGLNLNEALELASQTVSNRPLARATHAFAEQLNRGERSRPPRPFPPLLACLLLDGFSGGDLVGQLRVMAANYQDEVRRRSVWVGTWAPAIFTLVVGGGLTLFHALVTLGPWLLLMRKMAEPY